MRNLFILLFFVISSQLFAGSTSNDSLIINGNKLYNEAQYKLAIIEYQKVLEFDPDNSDIYYNLGIAFRAPHTKKIRFNRSQCNTEGAKFVVSTDRTGKLFL